ncbi:MAG: hypothetical protein E7496_03395 [Ruminococcus sp.]|nr:hypothetical protein [Ruminococcus sp.]
MRKKSRIVKAVVAGILAVSMMPLTGCGQSQSTDTETVDVAVIVKTMNSDYWNPVWKACDNLQEEFGDEVNIIRMGPEEEDAEQQIAVINQAISQKVDVIVLAACDPESENEALASATAAGIPIITIDSDVTYEGKASYVGTLNKNAGEGAARTAATLLNNEGTIGIIYHGSASTAIERRDGFINQLSGNVQKPQEMAAGASSKQNNSLPAETETDADGNIIEAETETAQTSDEFASYANIKIAEVLDGESNWDVSKEQALKLIKEDHVDLIFATNRKGAWGACEAVSDLIADGTIQPGEVHIVGFDYFENEGKSADMYLSQNILDATIIQNPYNMGYLGVSYAIDLAHGDPIPSLVDSGATTVTKDNINNDDVQFLINN